MNKDFDCLHKNDSGYQCDCVECYEVEIDRLRSENEALIIERDHARQDAASVRLRLAETQRPFTVTVEIPELLNSECNMSCPFSGKYINRCGMKWDVSGEDRPGPGCPRYPKPDSVDTDT